MIKSNWLNLAGYQATWLITVAAAGSGRTWPGLVAAGLFAVWQIGVSRWPRADTELVVGLMAVGFGADSIFIQSGVVQFSATQSWPGLAPLWMIALWSAFALTLNHSLAPLQNRLALAAVFGAVGAPLAYWAAQRGWSALTLTTPIAQALLMVGAVWAVLMPLLCMSARRLRVIHGDAAAVAGSA